jgi:hypothetical protein
MTKSRHHYQQLLLQLLLQVLVPLLLRLLLILRDLALTAGM